MLHTTDKIEEGKNIVFNVIISYMSVNTHVNNYISKEMLMHVLANNLKVKK